MLRPSEQLYLDRIFRRVAPHLSAGAHVLDAGCGVGSDAEYLHEKGYRVTAIDIEAQPACWPALCARGIDCAQASAEALPYPDASFDAVWAKDALHHMEHPELALQEFRRVVRPGGKIVLIEANRYNPVFYLHLTCFGGHQHFTRGRFRRMLSKLDAGYDYGMLESRCLPWDAPWVLALLRAFEDALEAVRVFNPWLTYQVACVPRGGK
jgi:ubiquinone/menaquinone biosynthesis C-methylase UbiE